MAVDGYLNFDTRVDTLGFEQGTQKIENKSKQTADEVVNDAARATSKVEETVRNASAAIEIDVNGETVVREAESVQQKIQQILENNERSNRSKAAGIAAIYRKQGDDQKTALRKAWAQIERNSSASNQKIRKHNQNTTEDVENRWKGTSNSVAASMQTSSGKIISGLNSVKAKLSGFLKNSTDTISQGSGSIGKSFGNVSSMFGKLAGALGVVASAGALVTFSKQAVELASDMQEVQNVVDTAFGDMAYKMEAFAESSIKQFGISRLAAKQTGSVYAAMAAGMGIAEEAASDMAVALTGLSADMASFYNVEQDVASTALKSVFTGETETLKQFGIVMTQTNLEAYALSQGITKSYQAMTEAEKVQLRYGYIMQSTALAQGDFAKTSGGWANQIRILSEQWKEFSLILGNTLMNAALPGLRTLNDALGTLITRANSAYNALADFFGWEQVQSTAAGITGVISDSVTEQNALTDAVNETAKAQQNALAGFDKINKLSSGTAAGTGSVTASVQSAAAVTDTDTAAAETKQSESILSRLVQKVDFTPLLSSLNRLKEAAAPLAGPIGSGLQWLYEKVLVPLGNWVISEALPAGMDLLSGCLNVLNTAIQTLKPYWQFLWDEVLEPIAGWTADLAVGAIEALTDALDCYAEWIKLNSPTIEEFSGIITDVFDSIGSVLSVFEQSDTSSLETLRDEIGDIGDSIAEMWDEWGAPISANVTSYLDKWEKAAKRALKNNIIPLLEKAGEVLDEVYTEHLKPLIEEAIAMAGPLINSALEIMNKCIVPFSIYLSEKFGPIFAAFAEYLIEDAGKIAGALIDSVRGILQVFGGLAEFISGVFLSDWDKAMSGCQQLCDGTFMAIGSILELFRDKAREIMESAAQLIMLAFSGIQSYFREKFQGACSAVKNAFSGIGKWFAERRDDVKNVFSTVVSWFGERFAEAFTAVQNAFSGAGAHFETVVSAIKSPFETLQEWFEGIWDGISEGAKKGINVLLGSLSQFTVTLENMLNNIVDALNAARSFSIPEDVPVVGGTSFGLDLSHVDIPPIPRLATGTVIPANYGEFLAVLGDNRREAEIVSPISAMEQAMENVLNRRGGENGDIHLTVTLDGKTVYRTIVKKNNESIRMTGKNPLAPEKGATT